MAKGLPWNKEADILLIKLVEIHTLDDKTVDFDKVQESFPARTVHACRSRWDRLKHGKVARKIEDLVSEDDRPSYQQLFEFLRDNTNNLEDIANKFDVSPKRIREKLDEMEIMGYALVIGKGSYAIITSTVPQVAPPEIRIADLQGKTFNIGVASDWQAGSKWAQPTALNQFIKYAYEEYDVRHMMVPGDPTDGAYVYGPRHIDNLIPQCRPQSRKHCWTTALAQVDLVDFYAPKMPGMMYYMMGGNHDRSLISNSGMDPIRMICERRDDMHYGGYDVWSIRLTEKSYVRLVHPTGGPAYARSYKLQKGIENLAFEALAEAMREEMPPMTSILVMAHYHLTNHAPEPPLHGVLAGCFQGQTPYLKVKNLKPHIAGLILEVEFSKYGKLSQVADRPIFFDEIQRDWKNWPVPEIKDPDVRPDELGTLFHFDGEDPTQAVEVTEPK